MADIAQLLQTMRPMREPPSPTPIMPFLDMLAIGIMTAAVVFAIIVALKRSRYGLRRSAEEALAASRNLMPAERLAAQARLLRRLVRVQSGDAAARAEGGAWLGILDRAFATTFFTAGAGRAFGDALYRRGSETEVEALDRALSGFIASGRPIKGDA